MTSIIGAGAGAATLITKTITAASQANVTYSSIVGTYNHLQIIWQGRATDAVSTEDLTVQFNGDTGANYYDQLISGNNVTPTAAQIVATTAAHLGFLTGSSATANFATSGIITIPNYAGTTFNKNAIAVAGGATGVASAGGTVQTWSCVWNNTAAITSIALIPASGNWLNNSVVCLYGVT